ncbi:FAD binding domain-containing protein [Nocardioides marmotae]|uniref:FAD binding domain-containing protein n=1 Tax=Nocardioides marmotae TaxID=2663857 RepID=UPI0012B60B10|nr:FAD binding domain-containing protein [Nocardioides marmotae]MBC9734985.1 FAD binding domain-containing protein [Nocardioides marmotae]MTB86085.1 FAD-binding molybdopterin dehydrogenase [Nocardioides marmotae]
MDLPGVTSFRRPIGRADLRLAPGETLLAGGTWLFSEPQPGTTGLVDLTTLGWPAVELLGDGALRIGATCTIAELVASPLLGPLGPLARSAADAFLLSFKVQHAATVGGNIALALPAGAMTSLTAGLGGIALVWTPDGGERREPVAELVRGVGATSLAPGEVIRAVDVPPSALAARAAFRRMSLAPHGRSSAVVVGVGDRVTVTAATTRPVVLDADRLEEGLAAVDCWYDDPHGAPDWRAAVTATLAREVVRELRG